MHAMGFQTRAIPLVCSVTPMIITKFTLSPNASGLSVFQKFQKSAILKI